MFRRKLTARSRSYVQVVTVILILTAVSLASRMWNVRTDLTRDRRFTLGNAALHALEGLPGYVTARVVMSKRLPDRFAQVRLHVVDRLREFEARSGGRLKVVIGDPGKDSLARVEALSLGIEEVVLQEEAARGLRAQRGFFGLALIYGDHKEVFPLLANVETFEYDMIVRLMRLTGARRTIGVVEGREGHRFRVNPPANEPVFAAGIPAGFNAGFSRLKEKIEPLYRIELPSGDSAFSPGIDLLLVAAPERLEAAEKYRIDQFLMGGKPVVFLAPGVEVDLSRGLDSRPVENGYGDLLSHYGVAAGNRMVGEPRNWERVRFGSADVATPYPYWISVPWQALNPDNPITASLPALSFPWTAAVRMHPAAQPAARYEILAATSPQAWEETGSPVLYPRDLRAYGAASTRSFPLAVAVTGPMTSFFSRPPAGIPAGEAGAFRPRSNGAARLLVISNALFASDFYAGYVDRPGNLHLLLNALDQLILDPELIRVRSRQLDEVPLNEAWVASRKNWILWGNMGLGPLAVLLSGILIVTIRKRSGSRA